LIGPPFKKGKKYYISSGNFSIRNRQQASFAQYLLDAIWPAAGFMGTEIRCLMKLENGDEEKDVQSRVRARGGFRRVGAFRFRGQTVIWIFMCKCCASG
jgi:hypothetical protein